MANKSNKRRKANGEGGWRKLKNGKIEGSYTIYRKNGTSFRKSFVRDTNNEILDIKAKIRNLGLVDNNVKTIEINRHTNEIRLVMKGQNKSSKGLSKDMTFGEYADYYLNTHRKNGVRGRKIEPTTFASYVDKIKLLKRYIGNEKIADLTFEDLDNCINELHRDTCDTTARQSRDILVGLFKYALKDGVLEENVLADEKITLRESKGKKEKKVIKQKDLPIFVQYCMEHKYYDLIFILETGVRASELAGVTWNNINFEEHTAKIEWEYIRTYYFDEKLNVKTSKKIFKDLKTTKSYRMLGLSNEMIEILKEHKKAQQKLAEKNNKTFKETDWVFTTKNYEGYVSDYSSDKFRKVMDTIKIEGYKDLTLHCLRHTFCTLGIENGVKIEAMKEILGHSSIAVTSNWYTHLDTKKVVEASNEVNSYIGKMIKETNTK